MLPVRSAHWNNSGRRGIELWRFLIVEAPEVPDCGIDGYVRAIVEFDAIPQGEDPVRAVGVVDLPFAGKAWGETSDPLRMGEIPVDQAVGGSKTAKSKTLTAIIRDARGRWRVGRGHRDPQGLAGRGWRRDGQHETGDKGRSRRARSMGTSKQARDGNPPSQVPSAGLVAIRMPTLTT